ncbi:hypothetical protein CALVIDRAFT_365437 [Calocera viscosa TUFC12733]|uniref:Uncharacterized protein n=1 Tax=Calocera viscosa (strain TUFC12733) TaxID=1330018 RepID=A0A167H2T3_CALVF|nr:hypothetical protein CALVIDRAFT_365437 [Calocera viscosa TUFC12733]
MAVSSSNISPHSLHELKRSVPLKESHQWWRQFHNCFVSHGYEPFIFGLPGLPHTLGAPPKGEERGHDPMCCQIEGYPARKWISVPTTRGRPFQEVVTGRWKWIEAVMMERKDPRSKESLPRC